MLIIQFNINHLVAHNGFQYIKWLSSSICPIETGVWQVQQSRVIVDLGVMAMKW